MSEERREMERVEGERGREGVREERREEMREERRDIIKFLTHDVQLVAGT